MREHPGSVTVIGALSHLVLQLHSRELKRKQEEEGGEEQQGGRRKQVDGSVDEEANKLVARIGLTSGGLAKSIELYGDYVVRQIGLNKESSVAKGLAEVAMGYLRGDKTHSDLSRQNLVDFVSQVCGGSLNQQQLASINEELVKELDACMLSYFSFHWKHSAHLLDQVASGERKLKDIVKAATRNHRLQKAMATLKGKRAFTTLVETIKAMGKPALEQGESRRPVLILVGGGMGAGKSTVVKNIISGGSSQILRPDAVIVEADQFKETDVLYRALSSGAGDMSMASQVVHDSSTRAASSLLVSALNEGRDVVFDGTMSWEPFVMQTIAMVRDVHRRRYRLGPGYQVGDGGTVVERYWEPVEEGEDPGNIRSSPRLPYRIELVAVTSDALLAVVRGIRRAIITNRFVPVNGQLRSHKLFAASLEKYWEAVDSARIFTTSKSGVPELIGSKDSESSRLQWIDHEAPRFVRELSQLNPEASCVFELQQEPSKAWVEIALSPHRPRRQQMLRDFLSSGRTQQLDAPTSDDDEYSFHLLSPSSSVASSDSQSPIGHCLQSSLLTSTSSFEQSQLSSTSSLSSLSSLSSEASTSSSTSSSGSRSPSISGNLLLQQSVEDDFIASLADGRGSEGVEEDFLASLRLLPPQEDYVASFQQEQRVQEDFIASLQ